ncbi:hypothetical protein D3C75_959180 [compost metagenome]
MLVVPFMKSVGQFCLDARTSAWGFTDLSSFSMARRMLNQYSKVGWSNCSLPSSFSCGFWKSVYAIMLAYSPKVWKYAPNRSLPPLSFSFLA